MFAKLLLPLLIVACASGCLAESRLDWQPLLDQQQLVMRQMVSMMSETRSARAGAADINVCFDWYRKDQAGITETYDQEYTTCVDASVEAKKLLSEQSAKERSDLVSRGQSICSALSGCETLDDSLAFYVCYNNASINSTQKLYGISSDSERVSNYLSIQYQRVENDERVCCADARNTYVNSLSTSATKLNRCLAGEWVPSEVTETTPARPEVTTEAQDTTESDEEARQNRLQEEDVHIYKPMALMNKWNTMRRF